MDDDDFESQFSWTQNWSNTEHFLWDSAFGEFNDPTAQALFHAGYFDQDYTTAERAAIRAELDRYLDDEYDIDFDDVFDWESWRESYGEAA